MTGELGARECPVFPFVSVDLTDGAGSALTVIDRVMAALERDGQHQAAKTFRKAVRRCRTDDEVLIMADALVTLIQ